jgi:hypothetical protein
MHSSESHFLCCGVGTVCTITAAKRCMHETGLNRSNVQCILKCVKWKVYIARIFPFCEWSWSWLKSTVSWMVLTQGTYGWVYGQNCFSNEAAFELNFTLNYHDCVNWVPKNWHICVEKEISLAGLTSCGLSCSGLTSLFVFWKNRYWPCVPEIHQLYGNETFYF